MAVQDADAVAGSLKSSLPGVQESGVVTLRAAAALAAADETSDWMASRHGTHVKVRCAFTIGATGGAEMHFETTRADAAGNPDAAEVKDVTAYDTASNAYKIFRPRLDESGSQEFFVPCTSRFFRVKVKGVAGAGGSLAITAQKVNSP